MSGLPRGWVEAEFGDVFDFKGGSQPPKSEFYSEPSEGRVRLLQIRDFASDEKAVYIRDNGKWPKCSAADIMIGRYGASVGKILSGKAGAYNVALVKLEFSQMEFDRHWVQSYLKTDHFQRPLFQISRSAQNGFNKEDLKEVPVPIPPLAEQKRIVAKLDALNAKSARTRTELARIETLVSRYKQAVLSKAFSGELTNGDTFTDWPRVRLEEIAEVGTGATPKRGNAEYYSNGTIPWVTSGAVNQRLILQADEFITERAIQETNCKVFPAGTLVVAMYGEGKTRGKVAVLGLDAATNQALAAVRIRNSEVSAPQYVYLFLQSVYLTLREEAAGGVQPNLNLSIVKAIELPLPPLEEQHEIVRRIESAFAKIDRLAKEAKRALELVGRLDEAILAKAFRGELVQQDENDEPAELLLARIRAEREAAPKAKRGRGAKG